MILIMIMSLIMVLILILILILIIIIINDPHPHSEYWLELPSFCFLLSSPPLFLLNSLSTLTTQNFVLLFCLVFLICILHITPPPAYNW